MSESSLSRGSVYSPRPTVQVAGRSYDKLTDLMLGLKVTEGEGGMSSLELRLSNWASDTQGGASPAFEQEDVVKLGSSIEVYSGDETSPREIFRGKVTGLDAEFSMDGAPELVVLAEDALQLARLARRTLVHDDVTLSDLASDVAQKAGLTPRITGLTDSIGLQVQWNESDLAFLRRLLAAHDGDLQVVGSELQVSARADVQRGTLTLEMYSQLRQARVVADLAHQATKVTAGGWNAQQGQGVSGSSTGAHLGPGSGRAGARLLQDMIGGERVEHLGHLSPTTDAEAQALADAAFDQRARRFVRVHGVAEGNALLRVGTSVALTGISHRFDNTYYVVRAVHRYDLADGYRTEFEAEGAYLGDP